MSGNFLDLHACRAVSLKDVPRLLYNDFNGSIVGGVKKGLRIVSFWGKESGKGDVTLFVVLADDKNGKLFIASSSVKNELTSITEEAPEAHLFEREIAETCRLKLKGHPRPNPVRVIGKTDFFKVEGGEAHEVAVGPVHAGVIEPGHFRFQCHGEHVFNLEIALGYQHRGVERALVGGPDKRTIHYMETLAGDTTIGHAVTYCQAVEALTNSEAPLRALALRGIMLELERIANHTGDLGALSADVGYLPTASYCGRLRGDFLNMTALICGSRFGRGMVRPGGVMFDIDEKAVSELKKLLDKAFNDLKGAVSLLWGTSSVLDRFEETGVVSKAAALDLGLVGPAARASGIERDTRFDFPFGIFRFVQIPLATYPSGDVFSRAFVRWLEIQRSVEFIKDQLDSLPKGGIYVAPKSIPGEKIIISLAEAWRGEICHAMLTDARGNISQYKITDPSFHNWIGLEMAVRGEEISNFPLCNKSFNLSYSGHDL